MGSPRTPLDANALDQLLGESIARHAVPGAVVGVLQGSTLTEAAAGVTNLATGAAVERDTLFLIGSISKLWTTTLVMQLVDSGTVELDAPVRRYLPHLELSDRAALDAVTVRHLLSHTSGIDEDLTLYDGREDACVERYVERVGELPQLQKFYPPPRDGTVIVNPDTDMVTISVGGNDLGFGEILTKCFLQVAPPCDSDAYHPYYGSIKSLKQFVFVTLPLVYTEPPGRPPDNLADYLFRVQEILQLARDESALKFGDVRGVVADLFHVDVDSAPLVECQPVGTARNRSLSAQRRRTRGGFRER
jgi:hypothetical protein